MRERGGWLDWRKEIELPTLKSSVLLTVQLYVHLHDAKINRIDGHGRNPSGNGKGKGGTNTMSRKRPKTPAKRWSAHVMETSNALDLQASVFLRPDPKSIARSLKRSAERSRRRKTDPFRSAMSMLTFYINRAGKKLRSNRLAVLEQAKDELRAAFHRPRSQPACKGWRPQRGAQR